MSKKPKVTLFTDGSCLENPGPGGWACLLRYGQKEKMISGGVEETTNNQMELQAVIEGLKALKKPCQLAIYTDSKYVIDGFTKWMTGWKQRGWKKSDKSPVLNQELWKELDSISQNHEVEWNWVKGHSGHAENERVDEEARMLATKVKQRLEGI